VDRCIESMKIASPMHIGVSKKTEKPIKPRKPKKKTTEKTEPKKKPIKILKNRLVRFGFISKKPKNRTEPKPKKTEPNRKNRAKTEKTKPNRFRFGFGFFLKKISVCLFFSDKNRTEQKMITPTCIHPCKQL